jgi:hypothetical protein
MSICPSDIQIYVIFVSGTMRHGRCMLCLHQQFYFHEFWDDLFKFCNIENTPHVLDHTIRYAPLLRLHQVQPGMLHATLRCPYVSDQTNLVHCLENLSAKTSGNARLEMFPTLLGREGG